MAITLKDLRLIENLVESRVNRSYKKVTRLKSESLLPIKYSPRFKALEDFLIGEGFELFLLREVGKEKDFLVTDNAEEYTSFIDASNLTDKGIEALKAKLVGDESSAVFSTDCTRFSAKRSASILQNIIGVTLPEEYQAALLEC